MRKKRLLLHEDPSLKPGQTRLTINMDHMPTAEQISQVMSIIGRKGKGRTSPAKAKAARANGRRQSRNLTWKGKTHNLTEWSAITGIPLSTLVMRLRAGWSAGEALGTEVRGRRP